VTVEFNLRKSVSSVFIHPINAHGSHDGFSFLNQDGGLRKSIGTKLGPVFLPLVAPVSLLSERLFHKDGVVVENILGSKRSKDKFTSETFQL